MVIWFHSSCLVCKRQWAISAQHHCRWILYLRTSMCCAHTYTHITHQKTQIYTEVFWLLHYGLAFFVLVAMFACACMCVSFFCHMQIYYFFIDFILPKLNAIYWCWLIDNRIVVASAAAAAVGPGEVIDQSKFTRKKRRRKNGMACGILRS